jgi:ribokinase
MSSPPKVVVVGSINMDLVIRCDHLPVPGETITAQSSLEIPGGKGANQSVAAARAGGDVSMLGRVGDDSMANRLLENLHHQQVKTETVLRTAQCASGIAVVAVEASGQNAIMVVPGANGRVSVDDVDAAEGMLRTATILLMQLEIPIATVLRVIEIAKSAAIPVVLDPAPMPPSLPQEVLRVDLICPNESEASAIVGYDVTDVESAEKACDDLVRLGAGRAIVTLAEKGAVVHDGDRTHWIQPFEIEPVDTTAAGDAFAGALAVELAGGKPLIESARFASAAGAIAATRLGAQPAMPTRQEIEELIRNVG